MIAVVVLEVVDLSFSLWLTPFVPPDSSSPEVVLYSLENLREEEDNNLIRSS